MKKSAPPVGTPLPMAVTVAAVLFTHCCLAEASSTDARSLRVITSINDTGYPHFQHVSRQYTNASDTKASDVSDDDAARAARQQHDIESPFARTLLPRRLAGYDYRASSAMFTDSAPQILMDGTTRGGFILHQNLGWAFGLYSGLLSAGPAFLLWPFYMMAGLTDVGPFGGDLATT